MNIPNKLKEVINILADVHDAETDKNYPEEKCLACMCQEDLQEVIYYINNNEYSKLLKDMRLYLIGNAPLEMKADDLINRIDNFA